MPQALRKGRLSRVVFVDRERAETEERALVCVAAARAKKELLVLSHGRVSRSVGVGGPTQSRRRKQG